MDILKSIMEWFLGKFSAPNGLNFEKQMYDTLTSVYNDSLFSNMVNAMVPVGICLAMIYLMKELLEKTSLKNIDLEQIIKLFIKLVIAFAIITNVFSLFKGMNEFVHVLTIEIDNVIAIANISDASTNSTNVFNVFFSETTFSDIADPIANTGMQIDVAVAILVIVGRFLASIFYSLIIAFVGFSRTIKIGYKTIFAPVIVSNIVGYSTRNTAVSYCKEMFALFMQYPIACIGYAVAMRTINQFGSISSLTGIAEAFAPVILLFLGGIWISRSARISQEMFC